MDWIHFWIIQIAFLVGFWLGPIQVEPTQSRPMLTRASPNRCLVIRARIVIECPSLGRSRVVRAEADFELSGPRPILRWAGSGRRWVERARVDVESSRLGSTLSRAGPGWCWVERARARADLERPRAVVTDPDWCWAERARANVDSSGLGPMSFRADTSRCWVVRAYVDVKS